MAVSRITCEKLISLKEDFSGLIEQTLDLIDKFHDLAREIDKVFKGVKIGKVAGATTAIVGGVMAGIGFGLSFFTFGASFGLTIAGAVIAGAGGATVGIAQIVDTIHSSVKFKEAVNAAEELNRLKPYITDKILDLEVCLEAVGDLDRDFGEWVNLIGKLVLGGCKASKSIGWNIIGASIRSARAVTAGIAMGGSKAGVTAFKTVGTTTARAAGHIGFGVVGILLIPLDIYTLVDSAIDLHSSKPHKVSEQIREMAKLLNDGCPTKEEVNTSIETTVEAVKFGSSATVRLL